MHRIKSLQKELGLSTGTSLPSLSFVNLWHVGTMDVTRKRQGSHEGSGLSVSVNPREWQQINPLTSGEIWRLTKPGNRFLDYLKLTKSQTRAISEWGLGEGLTRQATLYRVSWFDDEMNAEMCTDFHTREEAEEEHDEGMDDIQEVPGGLVAEQKMLERLKEKSLSPLMVSDLVATLFSEDVLHWDGVWWSELLDVSRYSAPRGVITNSSLAGWTSEKVGP